MTERKPSSVVKPVFRMAQAGYLPQLSESKRDWPQLGAGWAKRSRVRCALGKINDSNCLTADAAPSVSRGILPEDTETHREFFRPNENYPYAETRVFPPAHLMFAEPPKAFRHRLETLWEHGR